MDKLRSARKNTQLLLGSIALLILGLAVLGYEYYGFHTDALQKISTLNSALAESTSTNQALTDALTEEKARNDDFENQIQKISGTVGTLDKLSKTDPQLLAKYSKVYFLNENYTPPSLSNIPAENTYDKSREYQFLSEILPHLEDLIADASDDGISLEIVSSYRSFGTQAALKSEYKVTYGSGANAFSADQGYSEHQLGTTVDFTTPDIGATFSGFDTSTAYTWLTKDAYKYGFILSYPPKNAYYVFEPWHWRFVGIALATKLHDDKQYFYDLDQREINTYLVSFYDDR
jgi:LAS superfamily LD-carboxypeptidase LdcB